jgi:hypothetical protein
MLKMRDLMKAKLLTTALVLLGCIEAYAVSPPAPSYSLTDIGVLPGFTGTWGSSINVLGQVAGYCYSAADLARRSEDDKSPTSTRLRKFTLAPVLRSDRNKRF